MVRRLALLLVLASPSWGATTRYLRSADSTCGGGADFNEQILLTTAAAVTISVSVSGLTTEDSFAFSEPLDPNDNAWDTGDWTVEVNVTNGNGNMDGAVAIARVNSACAQQEISSFTAFQTLTAGVKTYSLSGLAWTSGNYGDRIKVVYRFRNNFLVNQNFSMEENTDNAEIVGPLPRLGTHTFTPTITPTATPTITRTSTPTVSVTSTPTVTPTFTTTPKPILVYSDNKDGDYEIFRCAYDFTEVRQLTFNNKDDDNPTIVRGNGTDYIVFRSFRDNRAEFYRMNLDGTGQVRISNRSLGLFKELDGQ